MLAQAIIGRTIRDLQLVDAVLTSSRASSSAPAAAATAAAHVSDKDLAITKIQALSRGFVGRRRVARLGGSGVGVGDAAAAAAEGGLSTPRKITPASERRAHADAQADVGALRLAELEAMLDETPEAPAASAGGPMSPGAPTPFAFARAPAASRFVAELDGVRVGVPRSSAFFTAASPAVLAVIDAALSRLAKAGAVLVDVDLDFTGTLGEVTSLASSAASIAATLLAYESPRELASYAMGRTVPAPPAPKAEGDEGDEGGEEGEGEGAKAPPAPTLVALDSLVKVSSVFADFRGPAPQRALLAAQLTADATSAADYRAALVYQRPALKRAFTTKFKAAKSASRRATYCCAHARARRRSPPHTLTPRPLGRPPQTPRETR